MILILRKEKYILGRIGLYFWGFGEKQNYFRDLGSKGKIYLEGQGNYFHGFGEIHALFSGIKEAQTPRRPSRCFGKRVKGAFISGKQGNKMQHFERNDGIQTILGIIDIEDLK